MSTHEEILSVATVDEQPAPTLLPWVARGAAEDDLLRIARIAAAQAALAQNRRWPVVAEACAEVLAQRTRGRPELVARLVEVLPPIIAFLSETEATAVICRGVRPDAIAYAALTHPGMTVSEPMIHLLHPLWREILAGRPTGLPPLANLGLLARLVRGPVSPADLLPSQAVYLLPYLVAEQAGTAWAQMAAAEITSCLEAGSVWYAAALFSRAAPYLDIDIRRKTTTLPPWWAESFDYIVRTCRTPWVSAAAEIASAHPAALQLEQLTESAPEELAYACAEIIHRLGANVDPAFTQWEPDERVEPGQMARETPASIASYVQEERGQVALGDGSYEPDSGQRALLPGISSRYQLLEILCERCGSRQYRIYYDERDHVCESTKHAEVVKMVIKNDT
jgi:hypothetical protein